ncbi:hypothetical protein [Luteimonas salinilitoris]|uniref:Uncharacterized protein n=1 Tax=Luteimonas salinilitoris TaxID=3237697 RepID=A0ABV4HP62_9GAMM
MDEIVEYLLSARPDGHDAKPRDDPPSPVPAAPVPAEREKPGGAGTPDLLGLLFERLGDETVRRAIARLIFPH